MRPLPGGESAAGDGPMNRVNKSRSRSVPLLTITTMPSCSGPLVLSVSFSPSMEYSHSSPFSMNFFGSASSLFAFRMKCPVTWFLTAAVGEVEGRDQRREWKTQFSVLFGFCWRSWTFEGKTDSALPVSAEGFDSNLLTNEWPGRWINTQGTLQADSTNTAQRRCAGGICV